MQNVSKKLVALALMACGFGLTQISLAGDRVTAHHSTDYYAPYAQRGHHQPKALSRGHTPYHYSHRQARRYPRCDNYGYRHGYTRGHYDRHGYGFGKIDSDWDSPRDREVHRRGDYHDRGMTQSAYAKGYRY